MPILRRGRGGRGARSRQLRARGVRRSRCGGARADRGAARHARMVTRTLALLAIFAACQGHGSDGTATGSGAASERPSSRDAVMASPPAGDAPPAVLSDGRARQARGAGTAARSRQGDRRAQCDLRVAGGRRSRAATSGAAPSTASSTAGSGRRSCARVPTPEPTDAGVKIDAGVIAIAVHVAGRRHRRATARSGSASRSVAARRRRASASRSAARGRSTTTAPGSGRSMRCRCCSRPRRASSRSSPHRCPRT